VLQPLTFQKKGEFAGEVSIEENSNGGYSCAKVYLEGNVLFKVNLK